MQRDVIGARPTVSAMRLITAYFHLPIYSRMCVERSKLKAQFNFHSIFLLPPIYIPPERRTFHRVVCYLSVSSHNNFSIMASDDLVSLPTLYARAVTAVTSATEPWPALTYLAHAEEPTAPTPSNPPSERAEEAIRTVKSLSGVLHAAAVLSPNEDLDEIATRNLKYLITPYLSALASQAWQGKPADRLDKLNDCMQYLQLFFDSMHKLRLLSERERDAVLDNTVDATLTPAEKRETKIARFKMEKAAEKKLRHLMERLQKNEQEDDEEGEREAYLVVLQSAVRKALDLHTHIQTEMELLSTLSKCVVVELTPVNMRSGHVHEGPYRE